MRVFINMGTLSDENGAHAPGQVFVELARTVGVATEYGRHWGQDSLTIPETDWPRVKQRLEAERMVYRVEGVHNNWQNVFARVAEDLPGGRRSVAMPA